ncbi:MAG: MlaD family protein [Bacteroidota bacterium]
MRRNKELNIGLTVIAAIVLFYLVVAWTSRIHLFAPEEYRYTILFDNVNGLLEGDPVNVRGYTSGRVEQIQPKSEAVWVLISLDQRIQLFQDVRAEIQIKELMGGKMIEIWPGQAGEPLSAGAQFPGRLSPDFSSAFSQFGQITDQLQPEQFMPLLQRLDTFTRYLSAISREVPPEQIGAMVADIQGITRRSQRLLAQLEGQNLPEKIDEGFTAFTELSEQGKGLMTDVDSLLTQLEAETLPEVNQLLAKGEGRLDEVQSLLQEVQGLTDQLQDTSALVGKMLQDPAFAQEVEATLYHLIATLRQIHEERVIVGFRRKKGD